MPYLLIRRRLTRSPETEQGLEGGHWLPAPIVAKDEFIDINLELSAAHTVMGSDQPLLQVAKLPTARSAKGTTDFAPFRNSVRSGWVRGACLKPASSNPPKLFRPSVYIV